MALPWVAFALALAQPSVVDGDTLWDAAGERYRVENIDAPERGARSECP
jgi:endonuclease YncB( thermonuclease family)